MRVTMEWGEPEGRPSVVYLGEHAIEVPDGRDRSPPRWWIVEALTGVPAERVVRGWHRGDEEADTPADYPLPNRVLAEALGMLERLLVDVPEAPTLDELRRAVVAGRYGEGVLPVLFVGRLDQAVDRARALLGDTFAGQLYTTIGRDGRDVPAVVVPRGDRVRLETLDTEAKARGVLLRTIRFARPGRPPRPTSPPRDVVHDLMTYPPAEWPRLDGIVRVPSIRADGTVLDRPGYDAATRIWYEPEPVFAGLHVPEDPTDAELVDARDRLLYPWSQFPYVDGPAGALAVLFEQVMLPMLHRARPLYVFDAPSTGQGTGKTLLARTLCAVILGRDPPMSGLGSTEEEREKRIPALLRTGDAAILIDNLRAAGVLRSEALDRLATSTEFRARTLGVTETPAIPNLATWILTLNGARLSKDLARRVVLTRLDAGTDAHRGRAFAEPDLLGYAIDHRAELIGAVLTLVRGWIRAGRPVAPELQSLRGGFEVWLSTVGACVQWCGIPGLTEALTQAEQRDADSAEDREFILAWWGSLGGQPVTAGQLTELAEARGLYGPLLADAKGAWRARRLSELVLPRVLGRALAVEGGVQVAPSKREAALHGYTVYELKVPTMREPTSVTSDAHLTQGPEASSESG